MEIPMWGSVPTYQSKDAAGADLRACLQESIKIEPQKRALVPTNTYVAIPRGYEGQVRARSGLAYLHGITVANGVGTIDADYRGEICVALFNMSDEAYVVHDGDRIAQLVVTRCERISWKVVPERSSLSHSRRGTRGFGSTDERPST